MDSRKMEMIVSFFSSRDRPRFLLWTEMRRGQPRKGKGKGRRKEKEGEGQGIKVKDGVLRRR